MDIWLFLYKTKTVFIIFGQRMGIKKMILNMLIMKTVLLHPYKIS